MKIYSGNKWHLVWSYEDLLDGGDRSWVAYHTRSMPIKGGHTHNHCSNSELKHIHTKAERKYLRKFLKKKLEKHK